MFRTFYRGKARMLPQNTLKVLKNRIDILAEAKEDSEYW